ncbi:hypothetical protein FKW77_004793 [Venturia effusa]|uniref:Uncharacterized protein n=1 Tax=Venturia effusa TaxID=50376 RepID=A0A517LQ31_9PEZI|nr:hypothetical protein FKW77_004793 [Venturia effusa]
MPPPKDVFNPIRGPGDFEFTTKVHNTTYPFITSSQFNLHGKAVLISGGSRGIGRATVLAFAKAGISYLAVSARSDVSFLSREIENAATSSGKPVPKFLALTMDVTSPESVSAASKKVEEEFGRLDILVNNAGILPEMSLLGDSDPDVWWETMNVNLKGPYLTTRAFLPLLLSSPNGSKCICNVASVGALITTPSVSSYQTSKLAVVRLTEFIAAEYADKGICAFSIHPGNVATDIIGPGGGGDLSYVFTETVDLAGDTVVWLVKEERGWLNGRYINVTWDMEEVKAKKEVIVEKDLLKVKFVYE